MANRSRHPLPFPKMPYCKMSLIVRRSHPCMCKASFSTREFIPLSFWYDAPLTSQDRDRRHDPWLVYRRGARPPSNIGQQPIGREWMSYPYPPETWATIGPGGHENTLGGDTGEWCG